MSRCFPFPPPGYEKKTRSDHLDSLAEEKRKEKKHKKEKRDKEKKEGKEKKEKDRSKDKHKDKKDQKEKHKDKKKKDKDKDKDRNRATNERPDKQSHLPHGDVLGECSRKTEEIKNSKFTGDSERRIKDEEKAAANRKLETVNGPPTQKSFGSFGSATTMVKEKATNVKTFPPSTGAPQKRIDNSEKPGEEFSTSTQRRNEGMVSTNAVQKEGNTSDKLPPKPANAGRGNGGMPLPVGNFMGSLRRGSEGASSANTVQKERCTGDKLLPKVISTDQRGNGGTSLPMENSEGSFHRRPEGPSHANAGEIDNFKSNKVASNSNKAVQRTINGMGQSTQSISGHKHLNSVGLPTKMEDRGEANKSIANHDHMVAKRIDGTSWPVGKDANNRNEGGRAKSTEKEGEVRREERHKDRNHDQKKIKDKDKHKRKEKEKAIGKEKGVKKHKEQNEPNDERNKAQLDSIKLKPLAPEKDNAKNNLIDGNIKKRKEIDINGFINENNLRPNKIPRTNSSTKLHEENGRTLESSHIATAFPSVEPETNHAQQRIAVDSKERMTNGIAEAQPSSAGLSNSVAADKNATGKVHKKPHPDSTYLDQIYSIPKLDEWNEDPDQEWLFDSCHLLQKPNPKLVGSEVPQVWSNAIKIDSGDVVALPYVIPY